MIDKKIIMNHFDISFENQKNFDDVVNNKISSINLACTPATQATSMELLDVDIDKYLCKP